jgi:TolB-like protein
MPDARPPHERERSDPPRDRLESWKEIAAHLRRDVRTLQRWEAEEGLPARRHLHKKRGTVYAYRSELEAWLESRASRKGSSPARRVMLAVLPFANLSGQAEQDYFVDGLTEEVLAQLGRLHPERLGVIARTSVMRYKGTSRGIGQIGRELRVEYILEGSVRRGAERLRVTAQLIRVRDQSHLWADCYEGDPSDVLILQTELARAIARQIHVAVTPDGASRLGRVRRVDFEAHEAFLKGRFHLHRLSRDHIDIAHEYFQLAVEKDSSYALAYAGIAYVWFCRGDCGFMPPGQAIPHARAAALKALVLDDTLSEVHELLGNVRRHFDWDWEGAERAFRDAIQLDPNAATAHFMYADFLVSMERPREATAEMTRALELDPLNFLFSCFLGWHLVYLRRYDEAITQLRKTLKTEPTYAAVYLGLWGAFYQKKVYDQALSAAQAFFSLLGDTELAAILGCDGAQPDYPAVMRQAAETLARRRHVAHVPALRIARLFAHAREDDRALDWLEKACDEREPPLVHLRVAWDWDHLRRHPRFRELMRRMNFPVEGGMRP